MAFIQQGQCNGHCSTSQPAVPPLADLHCLLLHRRLQELYDVLAQRDAAQEAFCSVCGDGHSGGRPAWWQVYWLMWWAVLVG